MSTIDQDVRALSGYAPALPTPFDSAGEIDKAAFERLCGLLAAQGARALIVCETTGEASTLSPAERQELVRIAVSVSRGRVAVIAGAGSNSTARAIELSRDAEAAGADAILSSVPYYNKPTQAGLFAHFDKIAQSIGLPIVLHDEPSRTACRLDDSTVARLAEMPRFIGLVDATGDVTRPSRLRPLVGRDFRLLSGDDATALAFLAQGGDGCISVAANVAPDLCWRTDLAFRQGQIDQTRRLAIAVTQLAASLFCETNPVPVKYALSLLGLMKPHVRLPLVELRDDSKAVIAAILKSLSEQKANDMASLASLPAAVGHHELRGPYHLRELLVR